MFFNSLTQRNKKFLRGSGRVRRKEKGDKGEVNVVILSLKYPPHTNIRGGGESRGKDDLECH